MNSFKLRSTRHRSREAGFTLIEIMVVVIIIGLLSAMIAPQIFGQQKKAFITKAKTDLRGMDSALELYRLDNFEYPTTSEGLQALVTNPGRSNWTGYLKKLEKDPWGNDYQYSNPGTKNPNSYDLWSYGADRAAGGDGDGKDIGNWEDQ